MPSAGKWMQCGIIILSQETSHVSCHLRVLNFLFKYIKSYMYGIKVEIKLFRFEQRRLLGRKRVCGKWA